MDGCGGWKAVAMTSITLTCTPRNGQNTNFALQYILPQFLKQKKKSFECYGFTTVEKVRKLK